MTVDPTIFFIMVGIVAFMIGLAKGGLGGTLGALATPLMALVMPADQVIGLVLPILMLADVFAVALHWRRWNGRLGWLLIPGSVLGGTIGIFLLMQGVAPRGFIATSAIFFLILNWIKVPYYWYAGLFNFGLLWQIAWLLPFVSLGVWEGKWADNTV